MLLWQPACRKPHVTCCAHWSVLKMTLRSESNAHPSPVCPFSHPRTVLGPLDLGLSLLFPPHSPCLSLVSFCLWLVHLFSWLACWSSHPFLLLSPLSLETRMLWHLPLPLRLSCHPWSTTLTLCLPCSCSLASQRYWSKSGNCQLAPLQIYNIWAQLASHDCLEVLWSTMKSPNSSKLPPFSSNPSGKCDIKNLFQAFPTTSTGFTHAPLLPPPPWMRHPIFSAFLVPWFLYWDSVWVWHRYWFLCLCSITPCKNNCHSLLSLMGLPPRGSLFASGFMLCTWESDQIQVIYEHSSRGACWISLLREVGERVKGVALRVWNLQGKNYKE